LPPPSTRSFSPKRRLYLLGKTLYRAVPPRIRAFLYPIAANAVLLRRLRPEVWIISGEERNSHLPLSICYYSVTNEQRFHLQGRIFGESFQAGFVGHAWLWNAFTRPPEAARDCSIIVAEVHEKHLKWMGPKGGLVIPTWIPGYAQLSRGPEVMKHYSIKNVLRKIRQQNLEYEATLDPKAFEFFYERMYLPYARNRYGEGAFIGSREELKGSFDNGELILVKKQNEYIAGQIVVYQGDEATMPTLGVLDGRWEFVAEGALAASY
jgi:hypothetical protein